MDKFCPFRVLGESTICNEGEPFRRFSEIPPDLDCMAWVPSMTLAALIKESGVNLASEEVTRGLAAMVDLEGLIPAHCRLLEPKKAV